MSSIRMFAAAAALAIATGAIGTAIAQGQAPQQAPAGTPGTGPRGMMGYGFMGPGMMGYRGMGMRWGRWSQGMCIAMAGHIEGRLAYLKAELKITEPQERLWTSYAAAARNNMSTMLAHCTAMMSRWRSTTVSLPDRLDQYETLMAARLEALRAMNKALKPLYAALSDSQKKTADQLFWGPMGMM